MCYGRGLLSTQVGQSVHPPNQQGQAQVSYKPVNFTARPGTHTHTHCDGWKHSWARRNDAWSSGHRTGPAGRAPFRRPAAAAGSGDPIQRLYLPPAGCKDRAGGAELDWGPCCMHPFICPKCPAQDTMSASSLYHHPSYLHKGVVGTTNSAASNIYVHSTCALLRGLPRQAR
jgi:hypothetical protein